MVEITRMIARALRHPSYGVNVQLATLPRYEEEEEIPVIERVLDFTEDRDAILQKRPLDYPSLIVSLQTPVTADREFGDVLRDSTSVPVHIDIVVGATEPAPSARDTLYYIRAILRCLADLMKEGREDEQVEHGIMLVAVNNITWGPVDFELPSGKVVGTVVPDFMIRDNLP